jgi:hypothetical protein
VKVKLKKEERDELCDCQEIKHELLGGRGESKQGMDERKEGILNGLKIQYTRRKRRVMED